MSEDENWRITLFKMINDFHVDKDIPDIQIMEALTTMIITIGLFSDMPPNIFKSHMEKAIDLYFEKDNRKAKDE